jgi:HlyD family secretion protein
VVHVAAAVDDIVSQILVREGEEVEAGQTLLVLDSNALRAAELEAARLKLERVGLQPYEIEAQRARARAIEARLEHSRAEVERQRGLSEKGFSAGDEYRNALLKVRLAAEELGEARAILKQLEAGLGLQRREAENELERAGSLVEKTVIRAPMGGRILKVLVRPGERSGTRSLLQMGQTREMYAVAEVHATDIRNVAEGQRARFTSAALPGPIDGVVDQVGVMIYKNDVFGEDPRAPQGLRVFEVRVRLDRSDLASRFTNLEGQVRIFLEQAPPSP